MLLAVLILILILLFSFWLLIPNCSGLRDQFAAAQIEIENLELAIPRSQVSRSHLWPLTILFKFILIHLLQGSANSSTCTYPPEMAMVSDGRCFDFRSGHSVSEYLESRQLVSFSYLCSCNGKISFRNPTMTMTIVTIVTIVTMSLWDYLTIWLSDRMISDLTKVY